MNNITPSQLKIITYALLPAYQLANILGWVFFAQHVKMDIAVPVVSCIFLAIIGIYSVHQITTGQDKQNS